MAELTLPDDLFRGLVLAWQYPGQKDLDVSCAEQRQGFTLDLSLAEEKQQGHQGKGDMAISGLPTPCLVLRPKRWLLQKNPLIAVNVDDEALACVIERAQKSPVLTVASIRRDPRETHSVATSPLDDLQSQGGLGLQHLALWRNACGSAALRIFYPLLRQVELSINQAHRLATSQSREDGDLTVVRLALPAHPLTGDPDRLLSLFRKAGLIEHKAGILISSQQRIDIARHLIHDGSRIPWRIREKVVQYLGIGIRNHFGHTLDVPSLCLQKTAQVLLGLAADISGRRRKKGAYSWP